MSGKVTGEGYTFSVRDYGIGIPEEDLKKVTEAFYMVDKSRSRKAHGAGIGLALCDRIVKLHDSSLDIQSRLGEGTTVRFSETTESKPVEESKCKVYVPLSVPTSNVMSPQVYGSCEAQMVKLSMEHSFKTIVTESLMLQPTALVAVTYNISVLLGQVVVYKS